MIRIACSHPGCPAVVNGETPGVVQYRASERGITRTASGYACRDHAPQRTGGPHGRDCPDRCSQCLGAAVRRVEVIDREIAIAGEPPIPVVARDRAARLRAAAKLGRASTARKSPRRRNP